VRHSTPLEVTVTERLLVRPFRQKRTNLRATRLIQHTPQSSKLATVQYNRCCLEREQPCTRICIQSFSKNHPPSSTIETALFQKTVYDRTPLPVKVFQPQRKQESESKLF